MKMLIQATLPVVMLAVLSSQCVQAQAIEEGDWRVMMYTPGGEVATAVYAVERVGGSTYATMKWLDGEVPVTDLHLEGDLMTFAWDPGFYMQCRLERATKRQFKGACRDTREHLGPAVFSPPGVDVTATDIDFDKAFDVWDVSKEEYIKERYPQPSTSQAPDVPEPEKFPARMVDIDGRSLHVVELGSGDVTVVLESGIGDDHQLWHSVQKALGRHARVVSYDRAGIGLSKAAPNAATPSDIAEELHDLLIAAGYAPPFVLVGHQAGAFTVRSYTNLYPDVVAGLVLVDPSHEDEDERYGAIDGADWEQYVSRKQAFFSATSKVAAGEFEGYLDVLASKSFGQATSSGEAPVIVLTGQRHLEQPRWVGETEAGMAAKKAMHQSLAEELGGGLMVSDQSAGYIHLEDPDAVVDAVKKILDTIGE